MRTLLTFSTGLIGLFGLSVAFTSYAEAGGPRAVEQVGASDVDTGVDAARARMARLRGLVGSFTLEGGETATDNSVFREAGTRECREVFGGAAILCEDARTLVEARGRYAALPSHRRSISLYRWNALAAGFERVSVRPDGPPDVVPLALSEGTAVKLSYPFVVASSSYRKEPLDAASEMTIRAEAHEVVQTLRSRVSAFQEHYREVATRR